MMDLTDLERSKLVLGHIFRTNTFWSTSRTILNDNPAFAKNTLLIVFLPRGRRDNVADVDEISEYKGKEAELLLNPFQMFRVEGYFSLKVIPHVFVLSFLDHKFHTADGQSLP